VAVGRAAAAVESGFLRLRRRAVVAAVMVAAVMVASVMAAAVMAAAVMVATVMAAAVLTAAVMVAAVINDPPSTPTLRMIDVCGSISRGASPRSAAIRPCFPTWLCRGDRW
jgi:hypothetical protein